MRKFVSILTLASAFAVAGSAIAAKPLTQQEEQRPQIRSEPIAGIYNSPWYSYLADVREAEQELGSDLKHSTDAEDRRDAWEEYHHELSDADRDYVKAMRKRGYRAGLVTVG